MLRRIAYHVFIDSAIYLLGGEKRDMTKLVINEHTPDQMPVEVVAGQIRTNSTGETLILIYEMNDGLFNGIYLRAEPERLVFKNGWLGGKTPRIISANYPHVCENATITVDINKE